jgi:tetratricopeptide (TPR) repeat protein
MDLTPPSAMRLPRFPTAASVDVYAVSDRTYRQLSLSNISAGGAFVRELTWVPQGDSVIVRITSANFEARARTVHVLTPSTAAGRTPGAGLMFQDLSVSARQQLSDFVATISGPRPVVAPQAPRHLVANAIAVDRLEVRLGMADLVTLWSAELSKGRLVLHSTARVPLRNRVHVRLSTPKGIFELTAEVVHQFDAPGIGVGLGFHLLDSAERQALERFITSGQAHASTRQNSGNPAEVMELARQFLAGAEQGARQALGLPAHAPIDEVKNRLARLTELFTHPPAGLTPPQRARLETALRALARVNGRLHDEGDGRLVVAAKPPEFTPTPVPMMSSASRVAPMSSRATPVPVAPAKGAFDTLPPERVDARELVEAAEVFATSGMKAEARNAITQLVELDPNDSEVLSRAAKVCAKISDVARGVSLAQQAVTLNPRNRRARETLVAVFESQGHWAHALRAASQWAAVDSDNSALQTRIKKLKGLAAKARPE